ADVRAVESVEVRLRGRRIAVPRPRSGHVAPRGEPGRRLRAAEAALGLGLRAPERRGRRDGLRQDRGGAALTRPRAAVRDERAARLRRAGGGDRTRITSLEG